MGVTECLRALAGRKCAVVIDERRGFGVMICSATRVRAAILRRMLSLASGPVYAACPAHLLDELEINLMVQNPTNRYGTPMCVGVDLVGRRGISIKDRVAAINRLADPSAKASDFSRPGNTFALRAAEEGVLARDGIAEAAVDLVDGGKCGPCAMVCDILNPSGDLALPDEARRIGDREGVPTVTVEEVVEWRLLDQSFVELVAQCHVPLLGREWVMGAFRDQFSGRLHATLALGLAGRDGASVHIHRSCLLGDVFGSSTCSCGVELSAGFRAIIEQGKGLLIYLDAEGSPRRVLDVLESSADGNHKAKSPHHSEEITTREAAVAAHIVAACGLSAARLVRENRKANAALEAVGVPCV